MKKMKLRDLNVGDVCRITYVDSSNKDGLESISVVDGRDSDGVIFTDIVAINFDNEDERWTAQNEDTTVHEVLFNYSPPPTYTALDELIEKYPEYGL